MTGLINVLQLKIEPPKYNALDTLARLIEKAQEKHGNIESVEVLELAAAAKEAIESLLSDMQRVDREALYEAILETFLTKGNA